MGTRLWVGALTALAFLGLGTELRAATVVRMSEAQMIQQSDWVGMGEVRSSRAQWIGRRLFTMVELKVSQSFKGSMGDSVTLVVPGGIDLKRHISEVVPGVPGLFPTGSRMLVFGQTSTRAPNGVEAVGLMQGMLFIQKSADGSDVTTRNLAGVQVQAGVPQDGAEASEKLSVLRERIRAMIQSETKGESR